MNFNNHIRYESAGGGHALSTRASSVTLSVSQRQLDVDGATENVDMTIAQELLDKDTIRIPKNRPSFSKSSNTNNEDLENNGAVRILGITEHQKRPSRFNATSNTWTSSEGDESDYSENEDRRVFVDEYNRLAEKYGVAFIVPDELVPVSVHKGTIVAKQGNWIMRKLLKRTSSTHAIKHKVDKPVLRQKRSVSDLAMRLRARKDPLKDKSLPELVRLCGASALYLPSEYSAGTLAVPTCFRATAQYLVQHAASTRGIFRVPGAHCTVMALYNHYATEDEHGDVISGTVRCPTLPEHIKCDVHDVASAFKKFLSGLPGGILGKAWLFEAFIAIDNQLDSAPEWTHTKQSRLRARLIALVIASTVPRYQRELICAVFGLLSMIGRTAETTQREDDRGRPLPTAGLMGYSALGVVFGPLLIGDILDTHELHPGARNGTLHLTLKSPKSLKGRSKKSNKKWNDPSIMMRESTEKVLIANKVTEMLITHWRDVVRHMKNLGALRSTREYQSLAAQVSRPFLRPSASEPFMIRKPPQWHPEGSTALRTDRDMSPSPTPRDGQRFSRTALQDGKLVVQDDSLSVVKQRSRAKPLSSQMLSGARSMSILAPTLEENQLAEERETPAHDAVMVSYLQDLKSTKLLDEEDVTKIQRYPSTGPRFIHESGFAPRTNDHIDPTTSITRAPFYHQGGQSDVSQSPRNPKELAMDNRPLPSENVENNLEIRSRILSECTASMPQVTPKTSLDAAHGDTVIADRDESTRRLSPTKPNTPGRKTPRMRLKIQSDNTIHCGPLSTGCAKPSSSTILPRGIVSNSLRGETASKPEDSPTGFRGLFVSSNRASENPQGNSKLDTNSSSVFSRKIQKDPLSRISQEEDIASLAALAEVIDLHDKPISHKSSQAKPLTDDNYSSREPLILSSRGQSSHTERSNDCQDEACSQKRGSKSNEVIFPVIQPFGSITPRRTIISTQSGGSVKALAAKFNNVELAALPISSPSKAPNYRQKGRSIFEQNIVSQYTSNTPSPNRSPQRSIRSGKSDKSLQSIRNPPFSDRISESARTVRLPKSPSSNEESIPKFNTDGARDSESPRYPEIRPFPESQPGYVETTVKSRANCSSSVLLLSPRRSQDNMGSSNAHKRLSLGRVLPRPDEPQVDQYVNFIRPSSMPTMATRHGSVSRNEISDNEGLLPISDARAPLHYNLRRGSSLLYSQVQDLQRQLRAKDDEAEQLRRQIHTKDSLNELCTLSEELRQTKRELISWKRRAETAEKRISVFSDLESKNDVPRDIVGCLSTAAGNFENMDTVSTTALTEQIFQVQNKGSNETVRRSRAYSTSFSVSGSTEFDGTRHILRAYENGTYELE